MSGFFRSMAGRVFIILVAGVLLSTALTTWLAVQDRQRTIMQFREARLLDQAELFIVTLDAIPQAGRPAFLNTSRRFGLQAEMLAQMPAADPGQPTSEFMKDLSRQLGADFSLVPLASPLPQCQAAMRRGRDGPSGMHGQCESLAVQLRDGGVVRVSLLPPRGFSPQRPGDSPFYLVLFLISIGILAWIISRMATRPLKQLAQAAENLGADIDRPPLQVEGALEIRQAATAFNAMQARIRDHIRQRTHMLAAITHDLQTPLTRLRLRIEKVKDDALRDKLIEDLAHTQAIVREGLDLARSMDTGEPFQMLDVDSLLDSVCTDAADAGQAVTLEGKTHASVSARPAALRRCLTNLVDNAVKYGHQADVRVTCETRGNTSWIAIAIRDRGPGVPPDQLARVFEPFYRIESSRSRETGGTGLGLTIARNLARQHGGDITLRNHPEGGLEATLLIPVHP
jgi:signal transduction histidine kinase